MLVVLIYGVSIIGSIILLIFSIIKRIEEKKKEEIEHKDYKDY